MNKTIEILDRLRRKNLAYWHAIDSEECLANAEALKEAIEILKEREKEEICKEKKITLRVSNELHETLIKIAEEQNRSINSIILTVISNTIKKLKIEV